MPPITCGCIVARKRGYKMRRALVPFLILAIILVLPNVGVVDNSVVEQFNLNRPVSQHHIIADVGNSGTDTEVTGAEPGISGQVTGRVDSSGGCLESEPRMQQHCFYSLAYSPGGRLFY